MEITAFYDEIAHCNKCGFCQVACPIFRSTGQESGVARGRLALFRAIIEGRLDWSDEIEAPLFDCLLCGACTSNCFPAIPTSDLVVRARSEYLDKVGRKPIHRLLFDGLLPYPHRLHLAARAAALTKKTGLSNLARALGLLRIFGRDFADAERILETFPLKALRDKMRPGILKGRGKSLTIGYFIGCGVDIVQQKTGVATVHLLRKTARQVILFDNCCCGLPAWSYGDLRVARKLAEKNLAIIASAPVDILITDCSSCASFLKQYPRLFPEEDRRSQNAKAFSGKVRDVVEWLHPVTVPGPRPPALLRATYHDPCHAVRGGQRLVNHPRQILKSLPGIEFTELPEADWCCGGAGAYALSQYDLYRRVLDRKIENVKSTRADVLATSCPACIIHLSYGVRNHGLAIRVCHLSEIVDASSEREALCIEENRSRTG